MLFGDSSGLMSPSKRLSANQRLKKRNAPMKIFIFA